MLVIFFARAALSAFIYPNSYCPEEFMGDGICDEGCMVYSNNFDSIETPTSPFSLLYSDCLKTCFQSGCPMELLMNDECDEACNTVICGWDGGKCGFCSPNCTDSLLTNNQPDEFCNTKYCFYDNNQYGWCAPGCFYNDLQSNIVNPACNVTECDYQNGIALYNYVPGKCNQLLLENQYCDEECNSEEFDFDNGKCLCSPGCYPDILENANCYFGNPCLTESCNYMQGKCKKCVDGCMFSHIGDGECQEICNIEECQNDGGDCGCAPSCKSTYYNSEWNMQGGCDLSCLVPSCLFNYKVCNDSQLISVAIMYSITYKTYNEKINLDLSTIETIKNYTSGNKYYQNSDCYSEDYLYCNGLAFFSELDCVRNGDYKCYVYNDTNYGSFQGLVIPINHPAVEFLTTVDELNEIIGGIVYFIKEGTFSKNSPNLLVLNSNLTLFSALNFSISPYNHIIIPEGNYEFYDKYNSSVYSKDEIFENYLIGIVPKAPKFFLKIEGIGNSKPIVYFCNLTEIYTEHNAYIKNIHFSGRYLLNIESNQDNCFYCPKYFEINEGKFYSDRNTEAENICSMENCLLYHSSKTFTLLGNAIIQDVIFQNFQQQAQYLILSSGHLIIIDSIFERIQALYSIIFSDKSDFGPSPSIYLTNVQVIDFNYGYEHIDKMWQSNFLTSNKAQDFYIKNVTFDYLMSISCSECGDSPLLSFVDLSGTLNILDCTFKNLYIRSLIRLVNSIITIPSEIENIDIYGNIKYYTQAHLFINNSVFENIYAQDGLFIIEMGIILQNQRISNCIFYNLCLGDKGLIRITGYSSATTAQNEGAWDYLINGTNKIVVYRPPRFFEFSNIEIKTIDLSFKLISIYSGANIIIKNVFIEDFKDLTADGIYNKVIKKFSEANKYLSLPPKSSLIGLSDFSSIMFTTGQYSIKIIDLSIRSLFSISKTFSTLNLLNVNNNLTIRNFSISDIEAESIKGIVLDTESATKVFIYNLTLQKLINNQHGLVKLLISDIISISQVTIRDCKMYQIPAIYIDLSSSIALSDFSINNLASFDSKGTLFNVVFSSTPDSCELKNIFMMDSLNYNGKGLLLYIDASSSNKQAKLMIKDIEIRSSFVDNSFIFIEYNLNLILSYLHNFFIFDSSSSNYGLITDFHNEGFLEINNFIVTNHSGTCGYFGKYFKGGAYLSINNGTIQNSNCTSDLFSLEGHNKEKVLFDNLLVYDTKVNGFVFSIKELSLESNILNFFNLTLEKLVFALNSEIIIYQSNFTNIYASGFFLMNSDLICDECLFKAFSATIIECLQNSFYEIKNSIFSDFYSLSEIITNDATNKVSSLLNCQFINNYSGKEFIKIDGTKLQIQACLFQNNTSNYDYQIGVSSSILELKNSKFINNPPTFFSGTFGSNILLESSEFYQNSSNIDGISQNLTKNKEIFASFESKISGGVAYIIDSKITVNNCTFDDLYSSNGAAIYARSSNVTVRESSFLMCSNSKSESGIIYLEEGFLMVINSTFFSSLTETSFIRGMYIKAEILGSKFNDNSNDFGAGIFLQGWKNLGLSALIGNCYFLNNYASNSGGGIYSIDMDLNITSSVFELNKAGNYGGGIFFKVIDSIVSNLNFYGNSSFISNSSPNGSGGAIKWLGSPPTIFGDIVFLNNSALFGSDFAAYPVKLKFESRRELLGINDFRPGGIYEDGLIICLADYYDNIANSPEFDKIKGTLTGNGEFIVSEETSFESTLGCFNLTGFMISGPVGQNGTMEFNSDEIRLQSEIYELSPNSSQSSITIDINLRECSYGEEILIKECTFCIESKYLIEPSKTCLDCPTGAKCFGGYFELPKKGYWKLDKYSSEIYPCPFANSCLGSKNLSNFNFETFDIDEDSVDYSGTCLTGYKGNMCASCEIGYSKSINGECSKCPNPSINGIIIASFLLLIIIISYVMITSTLKSAFSTTSLHSIYIKIFTNYLQIVSLTTELNLNWPNYVLQFFSFQRSAATSSNQLYSIDCFFDEKSNFKTEDIYYNKILIATLLPIAFGLISFLVWLFISFYKENSSYLKRELWTTIIVLVYSIHPNVLKTIFSSFSCKEIKRSGFWLNDNLDIQCWSNSHTKTVKTISLPGLIIWGFGFPIFVLIVMIKRFKHLGKDENRVIFGYIYNGFKKRKFFWEFVILYRKLLIICITVFMATSLIEIQALTVIILLVTALYFQYSHHPYTSKHLNYMETEALLTSTLTIYCGLYYLTEGLNTYLNIALFILILLGNFYFIIYWLYYMMKAATDILVGIFPSLKKVLKKGDFIDRPLFEQHLQNQGIIFDKSEGDVKFTFFKKKFCKLDKKLPGVSDMESVYLVTMNGKNAEKE